MAAVRACVLLFAFACGLLLAVAAPASAADAGEPQDQIVLSGTVDVPRGREVGEVVVLHGSVTVEGVVHGDVVVLDGRISVTGQVSGAVVAINGPVFVGPDAQIVGDVLVRDAVTVKEGAMIGGRVRQGTAFTLRSPIRAVGRFASWLAVATSTLILGLLLILVAPRGAAAVASVSSRSPWACLGWGVAAFVAAPVLAVLAVASLLGLPLGLALLLSLLLLYFVGYAWGVWALGRWLWKSPRSRALAFAFGWLIVTAVAAIPAIGGIVWLIGSVFGLGAMSVATWRSRGTSGKHRGGKPLPAATETARSGA
jgi:carbonic anhydrase/acetyltransferase-like protein (isoleucine patch superfamily)